MTNMDEFEAQFLQGAREGLSLDAAQTEHRLAALERALAAGAAPSASSLPKAPGAKAAFVKAVGTWSVVGALVGGGLGFFAGYRAASSPALRPPESPTDALGAPPPVIPPSAPAEPLVSALAPAPESPKEQQALHPPKAGHSPTTLGEPSEEHAPADATVDGLQEELSYLRRAQNALGSGDPQLALGLVRTLDERVPSGSGKMLPEREVTRIMSLCALERQDEAEERGRVFFERYGKTMYAERVRRSCAVKNAETETGATKH